MGPATATGFVRCMVVPSPSWPKEFAPQQSATGDDVLPPALFRPQFGYLPLRIAFLQSHSRRTRWR
jgi:hypothetical protein